MSSFAWFVVLVLTLTIIGSGTLLWITVKYYWAARGEPPPTGERRRKLKEEELRLRAKQIERAEKTPVRTRSQSFWDNRKQP